MPTIWENLNAVSINASDTVLRDAFLESFDKGIALTIARIGVHNDIPTFAFPPLARPVGVPVFGSIGAADFLLSVCWGAGLSPRPTKATAAANSAGSLRFVIDPLAAWSTSRVQLNQLDLAANPSISLDRILPPPASGSLQRESVVEDLLRKLMGEVSGLVVQSHPHSLRQWVSLNLPDPASLTQIGDAIAASLATHWTWSDKWVFLGSPGCSGECRSEELEGCGTFAR